MADSYYYGTGNGMVLTKGGELVAFKEKGSEYIQWYNIPDPTFMLEKYDYYSQYIFNSRADATEAWERYRMNIKKSIFK